MQVLPPTQRALVIDGGSAGCFVKSLSTPSVTHGSAVIRIEAASILPSYGALCRGISSADSSASAPISGVAGFSAIGRIAALGPDSARLCIGQLVYVDSVVRARDDPDCMFISTHFGGMSEGSRRLKREVWSNGTFAEYANMPLENCIPLDETRLLKELAYSAEDLGYMAYQLVPYAGLLDIELRPGETLIVCPATGFYSSIGVQVAIAMGARVIAMARDEEKLQNIRREVLRTSQHAALQLIKITGDETADTAALRALVPGGADAVLDMTPSSASTSTHTKSAIKALRRGGRVSLMGSTRNIGADVIMLNDIMLKGKMMYERKTILQFVKLLEGGCFPRGPAYVTAKAFALEDWTKAFSAAAELKGIGECAVFMPRDLPQN
ncbi:hypothetical protein V2A60_005302 [Cordyceps javanica]|uniref:Alcohol dehydrogenase protein n=1 Tax=Cordyceps javanica TaxID=43265 RepID=A0A545VDS4_9HYPO|nr:alcohol dehydrogenase protein [Cordyceps javanica]TQW10453.1 Zinc-binding dehydrogenase [Cordyceps javanica]